MTLNVKVIYYGPVFFQLPDQHKWPVKGFLLPIGPWGRREIRTKIFRLTNQWFCQPNALAFDSWMGVSKQLLLAPMFITHYPGGIKSLIMRHGHWCSLVMARSDWQVRRAGLYHCVKRRHGRFSGWPTCQHNQHCSLRRPQRSSHRFACVETARCNRIALPSIYFRVWPTGRSYA